MLSNNEQVKMSGFVHVLYQRKGDTFTKKKRVTNYVKKAGLNVLGRGVTATS